MGEDPSALFDCQSRSAMKAQPPLDGDHCETEARLPFCQVVCDALCESAGRSSDRRCGGTVPLELRDLPSARDIHGEQKATRRWREENDESEVA